MQKSKFKKTEIGMIPEDWELTTIQEIGEVIGGGTPSTKEESFYGGEIAWITPKDLSNYNSVYISKGERNITKKGLKNSSAKLMPKGTVLFTSRAPIGYVTIAKNEVCTNQGFKSIICNKNINNQFIYYWLKNNKRRIENRASGSTFQEIAGGVLKLMKIAMPAIAEQKAIAKILSDLDSKIELLQQQNKTLENIGKTIFKQWFVDIGEVPESWSETTFSELVNISTGKSLKKSEYVENGNYPILGANGIIGRTDKFLYDDKYILTGRVGTLGIISLTYDSVWISDNVLIIKPIDDIYFYFTYFLMKTFDLLSLNRGSTQPLITQTDLKKIDVVMPEKEIVGKFNSIVSKLFDKIKLNKNKISTLSKTRDFLLPKLMTGKIRVPFEVKNA